MSNNIISNRAALAGRFLDLAKNEHFREFVKTVAPFAVEVAVVKVKESHTTARHCSDQQKDMYIVLLETIDNKISWYDEQMLKYESGSEEYQNLKESRADYVRMFEALSHDCRCHTGSTIHSANSNNNVN